ncbi:hypothetical protein RHMOL_Rhmol13G0300600 [Rhododendron molle]|uniref:Uncharacterized protein n=1 Tax=Rhododendron molle TaxID=49168 RepID=A0ACC0LDW6_RHOML|nr:hypothetical protein RHMOL_Rhmol13G0300600 [Rhododendron molle]
MEAQGNGYGNGKHLPIIGNGFPSIHRASFSDNFVFGAASAAFQYEGAAKEGGRGPSIWDDFTKRWPGRITDGSNGNTAVDFYYQFKVPNRALISKVLDDFCDYVDLCFWEFGDRVKHWITLNEPWSFSKYGYATGTNAPGRGATAPTPLKSSAEDSTWSFEPSHRSNTSTPSEPFDIGNPATEPYTVTHNLLLAHAAAVDVYRKNYQASCGWIYVYPKGIYEIMMYIKKKYKNPVIYITENGLGDESSLKNRFTEARVDEMRTNYHINHLRCLRESIDDGVRVKGYFVWSLFDNFEWAVGYTNRFGLI